jgi:hypothetical protein
MNIHEPSFRNIGGTTTVGDVGCLSAIASDSTYFALFELKNCFLCNFFSALRALFLCFRVANSPVKPSYGLSCIQWPNKLNLVIGDCALTGVGTRKADEGVGRSFLGYVQMRHPGFVKRMPRAQFRY